ncbi:hypothetical protein [Phytoactinopolyspora halotolerans]|uniref:Gfo/Idh/MocA family oxidoreductase n=1 Tax=Phytoactinopolyspora halotolerans TaxID=1981512 RepID=A0A6L9SF74_9ACTN|nr:hypothetical protein [Phytoactinopolyspora halotolerans]NEE03258.1 hypothetical protein [Phytoactinopolyspora halotolerans]
MTATPSRRQILTTGAAAAGAVMLPTGPAHGSDGGPRPSSERRNRPGRKPRVAVIITEYRRNSHGDVITTKLLEGYRLHGVDTEPRVEVASIYLDQVPDNDVGRFMAERHGVPVFDTIPEALAVGETGKVAVDAVIIVGEHGTYPWNEFGQKAYPRRRFFDTAVAAMIASNRFVPIFSDKHLAQAFHDARHMYDTAQRYGIPFLAGSSLPLTWRFPALTYSADVALTEAVALGFSEIESYGFHTLEVLQCMAERRDGGERGVRSVQVLRGGAVWDAAAQGRWDATLMDAAVDAIRENSGRVADGDVRDNTPEPIAFLIEYTDGFRGTALLLHGALSTFAYAGRRGGAVESAEFLLEYSWPYGHFTFLDRQIEFLAVHGTPPYPVERTLLTTGILDAAMHSDHQGGTLIETPELDISYRPVENPEGTLDPSGTGIGHELPPPSPDERPYD